MTKQKLLSLLLSLSILIGMCPAFAAESSMKPEEVQTVQSSEQAADESAEQLSAKTGKIYTGTASQRSGTAEDAATNAGASRMRMRSVRSTVGDPNLDYVDQLSDNKAATESYAKMKSAFENSTYTLTSEGVAEISYEPQGTIQFSSASEDPTSQEKSAAMKNVFLGVSAFRYDHPEVFYLDPQCRASYNYSLKSSDSSGACVWNVVSVTLKINLLFTTSSALNTAKREYNNAVSRALTEAKTKQHRDEQVKALHDWLCSKITYLKSADYAHSSYGALVKGECVCEGYAKALKVLCDQLNIPCKMVLGTGYTSDGSDAHMWNYIRMEDGNWYAADATWDDQSQKIYDDYLLVGGQSVSPAIMPEKTFDQTHAPTGYFTTDTTTMAFRYPELSEQAYVREVELNQAELNLVQGRAANLTASFLPQSTVPRSVVWSSDDEKVVTVNENGRVTAEAIGSAVITAKSTNGRTASCEVNVHALAAPKLVSAEMLVEEQKNVVRWEESAGAEEYIVFRRLSTETEWTETARTDALEYTDAPVETDQIYYYTVCAVAKDGANEVRSLYDQNGVICFSHGIGLDCTELELNIGGTKTLKATVKMDGEQTVSWSSSDAERVSVDEQGNVTALRAGVAVITAKAGDQSAQCTVSVLPGVPELLSAEGGVVRWNAVQDAEAYLVYRKIPGDKEWTRLTDENGISAAEYRDASVEEGGIYNYTVRAVLHSEGRTLVGGYDPDGVSYVWETITLSQTRLKLTIGKSAELTAQIKPQTASVTWSSNNSDVVSVSWDGKVTAKQGGTAKITARGEYGSETVCSVAVIPAAPKLISADGGTVRWDAVSGAASYRVYRKTAGTGWKRIAVTRKTSYIDKKTTAGNTYYYTVRAYFVDDGNLLLSRYDTAGVKYVHEKITLPETMELPLGESAKMPAAIAPAEAQNAALTWTSSDPKTVSVDENGMAAAKKLGTADVTVRTPNGTEAVCRVTVSAPAPKLVSAKNGVVKWQPTEGALGYLVYRKAADESEWTLLTGENGVTGTQYTDESVPKSAVSVYTVRARFEDQGNTVLSACDPVGMCCVPYVSDIRAAGTGWTTAKVSWNPIKNADGYRVYRKTPSTDWKRITTTAGSEYADSGLTPGAEYIYTVRAYYNGSGEPEVGGYDPSGIKMTLKPTVPSGLSARSAGYNSITVKWSEVSGSSGYRVYRRGPNDSGWKNIKTVNGSVRSLTDTGLTCGDSYTYTVRAYKTIGGKNYWSGYDKAGTSAKPVPAAAKLIGAEAGRGSILVRWSGVSGASGYRIYRKTEGSDWTFMKAVGASARSWRNTGLTAGDTYTYTVRVYRTVNGTKVLGSYDKSGVTATVK